MYIIQFQVSKMTRMSEKKDRHIVADIVGAFADSLSQRDGAENFVKLVIHNMTSDNIQVF